MRALATRPKFFIDENLPAEYAEILRRPFKSAIYSSYADEGLGTTQDLSIFPELHKRSFTAIITQDRRQLYYPEERDGLRAAGLHWVGLIDITRGGIAFHSQALSMLATALPELIARHEATPHAFYLAPNNARALRPLQVEPI